MPSLTNLTKATGLNTSVLTERDIYLFKQGNHFRLYEKLGSHKRTIKGVKGIWFAVWAPNAANISVIGDFNHWDATINALNLRDDESGIWEGFIADATVGAIYKYRIVFHDGK